MLKQNKTQNITAQNNDFEFLKKHFSYCFDKDGNFDFDKFKKDLSKNKEINFSKESYGMDWLGKSYARLLASDEAKTLLKEDEEFNKKQENKNSENLLIKGDNLEVLKHLSNAYYEKIKMIYIDPPYNTGSDGFVYQDDRKFSAEELSKLAGVDEDRAKRILDFTQSKSNSHSAWLTFMYPRLYIAKQLLKDDGVIFISIDDNEVAQLRLLMDEIFGEENFVASVIWEKKFSPQNDAKWLSDTHDYILVYAKNKEMWRPNLLNRTEDQNKRYKNIDNDIRGNWTSGDLSVKRLTEKDIYEIITPSGRIILPPKGASWRFSSNKFNELKKDNRIWFGEDGNSVPRLKRFLSDVKDGITPTTLWKHTDVSHNQEAQQELKRIFDDESYFDTPKPVKLLKRMLHLGSSKNDLILDFFAGSGTAADAVMQLNAEDRGSRKFILAQLPEEIDKKKSKTAYDFIKEELKQENPTIFDVTKERIIRSAKKIQKDNKESKQKKDLSKQDFGFKIFETTPNDEGVWEDYNLEAEEFDKNQKLFDESGLSDEDLKILLTTWKTNDNILLTQDLKEINLDGYIGYYFDTKLYLMNTGFKTKNLKKLLEEIDSNKDFNPATVIAFGYNFESKNLREIAENIKSYANKKKIDVDFISRY